MRRCASTFPSERHTEVTLMPETKSPQRLSRIMRAESHGRGLQRVEAKGNRRRMSTGRHDDERHHVHLPGSDTGRLRLSGVEHERCPIARSSAHDDACWCGRETPNTTSSCRRVTRFWSKAVSSFPHSPKRDSAVRASGEASSRSAGSAWASAWRSSPRDAASSPHLFTTSSPPITDDPAIKLRRHESRA